jgi:RHS repeat-associated protein
VSTYSDRGFTMHEHLDEMGVIHMNGRIYDPLIGRFMSADPTIQAPYNLKSFNRYSYVWNNPLKKYDPSGFNALDSTTGSFVPNDPSAPGGTSAGSCRSGCNEAGDPITPTKPATPAGAPTTAGGGSSNSPPQGQPAEPPPTSEPIAAPVPIVKDIVDRPAMNKIAQTPNIQTATETAWINSNPDKPGEKVEQGFWITRKEDSNVLNVVPFPPGVSKDGVQTGPMPPDAIATVHTHPNTEEEGYQPGPSPADRKAAIDIGVPGIVRSHDGLYIYGPSLPEEKTRFKMPSFD